MRYQNLHYYILDYQNGYAKNPPELLRLVAGGNAFSILNDYCNMNGYNLIYAGDSRPSMEKINSLVKFPFIHEDESL